MFVLFFPFQLQVASLIKDDESCFMYQILSLKIYVYSLILSWLVANGIKFGVECFQYNYNQITIVLYARKTLTSNCMLPAANHTFSIYFRQDLKCKLADGDKFNKYILRIENLLIQIVYRIEVCES